MTLHRVLLAVVLAIFGFAAWVIHRDVSNLTDRVIVNERFISSQIETVAQRIDSVASALHLIQVPPVARAPVPKKLGPKAVKIAPVKTVKTIPTAPTIRKDVMDFLFH